jgi:hypothetical protein
LELSGDSYPARPCPSAQIQRKNAQSREKTVILPPLKPLGLKLEFGGRNGDWFMTKGLHGRKALVEVSTRDAVRPVSKTRPSLGSSYAILLLLSRP